MERRRHKRVKFFATARFGPENEKKSYFGNIIDVSYSGFFILTTTSLPPGQKIWIECKINGQEIKLTGKVARTKVVSHPQLVQYAKGGIGVEVDYMHPYITAIIDDRLKLEGALI